MWDSNALSNVYISFLSDHKNFSLNIFLSIKLNQVVLCGTMNRDKTLTSMQNMLKISREYTHNYVIDFKT